MKAQRVDTWAASLEDKPGALATRLKALAAAGVNLEFVIARRSPERPGNGVVFVTPIKGTKQVRTAIALGFQRSSNLHTVRIEGPDKRGQGANVAQALADKGINLRGLSAAAQSRKFVCHVALDTAPDALKALRALRKL